MSAKPRFSLPALGIHRAALRHYSEWRLDGPTIDEAMFVHRDCDGHQTPIPFRALCHELDDFFDLEEIALLKLAHLEKILGKEHLDHLLNRRAPR